MLAGQKPDADALLEEYSVTGDTMLGVRRTGTSPRANYAPVWFSACPRQSTCPVTEQCIHCKACVDLIEAGDMTQVHALPAG